MVSESCSARNTSAWWINNTVKTYQSFGCRHLYEVTLPHETPSYNSSLGCWYRIANDTGSKLYLKCADKSAQELLSIIKGTDTLTEKRTQSRHTVLQPSGRHPQSLKDKERYDRTNHSLRASFYNLAINHPDGGRVVSGNSNILVAVQFVVTTY